MKRKPSTDIHVQVIPIQRLMTSKHEAAMFFAGLAPIKTADVIDCGQVVEMRLPMRPEEK